jgi:hypothetical protein
MKFRGIGGTAGGTMKNYMGMGVAIGICWGTALGEASTFHLDPRNVIWLAIGVAVGVALGRRMNRRN